MSSWLFKSFVSNVYSSNQTLLIYHDKPVWKNTKQCPVCDAEIRHGEVLDHFRDFYLCGDCEHYIAEYQKFKKLHIRDAHTPAW